MNIDVTGISKPVLLLKLYHSALSQDEQLNIALMSKLQVADNPDAMRLQANKLIKEEAGLHNYIFTWVDFGAGYRELNVDLRSDRVDFLQYDAAHGAGTALKVIRNIRQGLFDKLPMFIDEDAPDNVLTKVMSKLNQKILEKMPSPDVIDEFFVSQSAIVLVDESSIFPKLKESLLLIEKYYHDPIIRNDTDSKEFLSKLKRMSVTKVIPNEFADTRKSEFYRAWLNLINPNIEWEQKTNIVKCLFQKHSNEYVSFAGIIFDLPKIMSLEFLRHSSDEVIGACQQYREQNAQNNFCCKDYFSELVKIMLSSSLYTKDDRKTLLHQLLSVFQQLTEVKKSSQWGNARDHAQEALAYWIYSGFFQANGDSFAQLEIFIPQHQMAWLTAFEVKLSGLLLQLNNSDELASLELDLSYYEDQLLLKQCLQKLASDKHDNLFAITQHLGEKKIGLVANMMLECGIEPDEILSRHAILVAKQEYNSHHFTSIFMSAILKRLESNFSTFEFKAFVEKLAASLNPVFYVNHKYAFDGVRSDIWHYWAKHMPQQLMAIIRISVNNKLLDGNVSIQGVVSRIPFDCFSEQFVTSLLTELDDLSIITIFSACSEEKQHKIAVALFAICTLEQGLEKLKIFESLYQDSSYPIKFKETFIKQLERVNSALFNKAKSEKLFGLSEQDRVEYYLDNFRQIFNNQSLTYEQRKSELCSLPSLRSVFGDKKTNFCAIAMKWFDALPASRWPHLFAHYDSEIIPWSFPRGKSHLKLLKNANMALPEERQNTWLNHIDRWQEILLKTLSAIADIGLDHNEKDSNVAHWALAHIQEALAKTEVHIEGFSNRVLKEFFLNDFINGLAIFNKLTEKAVVDHALIASWLPDNSYERQLILKKTFEPKALEQARVVLSNEYLLKAPFVRDISELDELVLKIINARDSHIINFLDACFYCRHTIIESLHRKVPLETENLLIKAINDAIEQLSHASERYFEIIRSLLIDISHTSIDAFELLDKVESKQVVIDTLCNIDFLNRISSFQLKIFLKFSARYTPETLYSKVTQHIINKSKRFFLYDFKARFGAANKIAIAPYASYVDYLASHPEDKAQLVKLLLDNISAFIKDCPSSFKPMKQVSLVITDFDDHLLSVLADKIKPAEKIGKVDEYQQEKWHCCLEHLVQVYGAQVIVDKCRTINLEKQASYLEKKFKHYPQILAQVQVLGKWFKTMLNPKDRKLDATRPMEWQSIHKINEATQDVLLNLAIKEPALGELIIANHSEILEDICKKANISLQAIWAALPSVSNNLAIKVKPSGEVIINNIAMRDQDGNYLSKAGIKFSAKYLPFSGDCFDDTFTQMQQAFHKLDLASQALLKRYLPEPAPSFVRDVPEEEKEEQQHSAEQAPQKKRVMAHSSYFFFPKSKRQVSNEAAVEAKQNECCSIS